MLKKIHEEELSNFELIKISFNIFSELFTKIILLWTITALPFVILTSLIEYLYPNSSNMQTLGYIITMFQMIFPETIFFIALLIIIRNKINEKPINIMHILKEAVILLFPVLLADILYIVFGTVFGFMFILPALVFMFFCGYYMYIMIQRKTLNPLQAFGESYKVIANQKTSRIVWFNILFLYLAILPFIGIMVSFIVLYFISPNTKIDFILDIFSDFSIDIFASLYLTWSFLFFVNSQKIYENNINKIQ